MSARSSTNLEKELSHGSDGCKIYRRWYRLHRHGRRRHRRGTIFGLYLSAALRNPSAAQGQFGNLIFGFAVTEALGIFSLLIALLLLFAL